MRICAASRHSSITRPGEGTPYLVSHVEQRGALASARFELGAEKTPRERYGARRETEPRARPNRATSFTQRYGAEGRLRHARAKWRCFSGVISVRPGDNGRHCGVLQAVICCCRAAFGEVCYARRQVVLCHRVEVEVRVLRRQGRHVQRTAGRLARQAM